MTTRIGGHPIPPATAFRKDGTPRTYQPVWPYEWISTQHPSPQLRLHMRAVPPDADRRWCWWVRWTLCGHSIGYSGDPNSIDYFSDPNDSATPLCARCVEYAPEDA